jgi:hypothetical protein
MTYNKNYREDFDDDFDDDGEEFDDDGDDLTEFDQDALFFNECTLKQINHELVALPNRELLEFLQWELDKLHFTENSELVPVGIEFQGQYLLQFYNVREDKTVKTATGAGNIYMLVDGWILKTLTDLYVAELYGEIGDVYPSDLSDCYTNILIDVLDWKKEAGIEPIPSKAPDDAPREDT